MNIIVNSAAHIDAEMSYPDVVNMFASKEI